MAACTLAVPAHAVEGVQRRDHAELFELGEVLFELFTPIVKVRGYQCSVLELDPVHLVEEIFWFSCFPQTEKFTFSFLALLGKTHTDGLSKAYCRIYQFLLHWISLLDKDLLIRNGKIVQRFNVLRF